MTHSKIQSCLSPHPVEITIQNRNFVNAHCCFFHSLSLFLFLLKNNTFRLQVPYTSTQQTRTMGNNDNNKAPSVVTTTITTTDTGNSLVILAEMLKNELKRKTDDLDDIRMAYQELLTDWKDDRPPLPKKHGHTVQVAWARAMKRWQYQQRLEEAVVKIESEIVQFRKEIGALLVAHSRPIAPPSE